MIGIIGLGFVGLTTALGFTAKGHQVCCYDKDQKRQQTIRSGKVPFHEPYLDDNLKNHLNLNLSLCNTLADLIFKADYLFYCVGTPCKKDGRADLNILSEAIRESLDIIQGLNSDVYKTLVIKSTVPPSTTQEIIQPILIENGFHVGENIYLANNPEFLREGFAWNDFSNPDRIIIGADDLQSGENVKVLYRAFNAPIHIVSLNTAEYIKYLSNTLLANLISFANEMSMIADTIGDIEVPKAFQLLHQDKRWSGSPAKMTSYVYPGIGFGGYCLPKDTQALYAVSQDKGYTPQLIKEILVINSKIKQHFVTKIKKVASRNEPICFLGLSFKPDSDDVRETPVKDIIAALIKDGYQNIIATDPIAINNFKQTYQLPIQYIEDIEEAIAKSEVVVLTTAWEEFLAKQQLWAQKRFIDGRYVFRA
jgi:UDPglucose 6-dehydrogenase